MAAVGRELAESITEELLGGLEDRTHVEGIVRGAVEGLWRLMDRDERLARLYFDLAAVSVVEPDVRAVMSEMKEGWRALLAGLLAERRRRAHESQGGRGGRVPARRARRPGARAARPRRDARSTPRPSACSSRPP